MKEKSEIIFSFNKWYSAYFNSKKIISYYIYMYFWGVDITIHKKGSLLKLLCKSIYGVKFTNPVSDKEYYFKLYYDDKNECSVKIMKTNDEI